MTKPKRKTKIGGEEVNLNKFPLAYDDLVRLSGNELTHTVLGTPIDPMTGLGMMDTMNALVTGKHPLSSVYFMRSPEARENMLRDLQRRYLDAAKDKVLELHPDLAESVSGKAERRKAEERSSLRQFGS